MIDPPCGSAPLPPDAIAPEDAPQDGKPRSLAPAGAWFSQRPRPELRQERDDRLSTTNGVELDRVQSYTNEVSSRGVTERVTPGSA